MLHSLLRTIPQYFCSNIAYEYSRHGTCRSCHIPYFRSSYIFPIQFFHSKYWSVGWVPWRNACHGHDNDRIYIWDDRITHQCIFSYIFQDCLVKKEDDNPTWEFCYPGRHAVTDLPPDFRWHQMELRESYCSFRSQKMPQIQEDHCCLRDPGSKCRTQTPLCSTMTRI